MRPHDPFFFAPTLRPLVWVLGIGLCAGALAADPADHGTAHTAPAASAAATSDSLPVAKSNSLAEKIRAAMAGTVASKKMTVTVQDKAPPTTATTPVPSATRTPPKRTTKPPANKQHHPARSTAATDTTGEHEAKVHWSYQGEGGPQAWGQLQADFNTCAIGKRQSPINIEDGNTLQGPAEPVQFAYTPSNGTVINNGHTIQVDVQGENTITVRGSTYRLLQFHFHTPSEEQINARRFPMVAHLVHKNAEGQLAVVAVLLDAGAANPAIDKVWTYMPLDTDDRVGMPQGLLNLNEMLPTDQRYYQFMGSLTTPPCTEGVLWMVMKQPVTLSQAQYKLFTQLYPNNARPVQSLNGRPVREAQ